MCLNGFIIFHISLPLSLSFLLYPFLSLFVFLQFFIFIDAMITDSFFGDHICNECVKAPDGCIREQNLLLASSPKQHRNSWQGCIANFTHAYRAATTSRNNRNAPEDEKNNVGVNMLSNSFNIKIISAFPAAPQFAASNPKWVCLVAFYSANT